MSEKRILGRPRKYPVDDKRPTVNFRLAAELKERLDTEALRDGLSLNGAAERRLRQSFEADDLRTIVREELRAELRAELRSEIRLAMAEYTVEIGEEDGDEARH